MDKTPLISQYQHIRQTTLSLCETLETEDFVVQSQPDVSPIKWHLAHTTWFFEKLILQKHAKGYEVFNQKFDQIFNSYYQTFGQPWSRHRRGVLSRPTVDEVFQYRQWVDRAMSQFLSPYDSTDAIDPAILATINTGLHHEQQHQELILMDIKLNFSCSPLSIGFQSKQNLGEQENISTTPEQSKDPDFSNRQDDAPMIEVKGGLYDIGASSDDFAYDNEFPRHQALIGDFKISKTLVKNRDYLNFVEDGGYENFSFWHADAWEQIQLSKIKHPMYWRNENNQWAQYTLNGEVELELDEPLCHINMFEASAFAEWAGMRLPTEFEWEIASSNCSSLTDGHFLEDMYFHPKVQKNQTVTSGNYSFFGGLWEWTCSSYSAYPGYHRPKGALKEYNSKFMINQQVLRGGSFATPKDHIRPSYRNFYQPDKAWPFTGLRLVEL